MKSIDKYIPFGKPNYTDEEIEAVSKVLKTGWTGMGNETISFEKELADYLQVKNVVCVNSCTSALFLSLLSCKIEEGDEVIIPSMTWCATINAILYLKAIPVFCDIDSNNFCCNINNIQQVITDKTKAVIIVHFGGFAVNVQEFRKHIPDHINIIEDAAHAIGSRYPDGVPVGNSNNLVCFSFYANKNLSTGDGGAIALNDNRLANKLRRLRNNGLDSNAWSRFTNPSNIQNIIISELGYKMNMNDLIASIGRVQLRRLDNMQSHRHEMVLLYKKYLNKLNIRLKFQAMSFHIHHAHHLLAAIIDSENETIDRDDIFIKMRKKNIGVSIHYPPLHKMPLYKQFVRQPLTITNSISKKILTLPISASITKDEVHYIVMQLSEIFNTTE